MKTKITKQKSEVKNHSNTKKQKDAASHKKNDSNCQSVVKSGKNNSKKSKNAD